MARTKRPYFRFTKGEWDPLLDGRADLDGYYASAKRLENVFVIPQGGVKRRPALTYRDTVRNTLTQYSNSFVTVTAPNGGTANNIKDGSLTTFLLTTTNISTTNDYIAWSLDLGSIQTISFLDIAKVSLTAGTSTEFQIEWSTDNVTYTPLTDTYNQLKIDTVVRYYRTTIDRPVRYLRLIRNGVTNLGTAKITTAEVYVWQDAGASSLSQSRLERFVINDEDSFALLFTDRNVAIYSLGILQANVSSPYISSVLSTINYTQSNDTGIYLQQDIAPYQLQRQGANNLWAFTPITFENIPKYNYNPTTTNPAVAVTLSAVTGTIVATGTGAFTAAAVGDRIDGNGGLGRIIVKTSNDSVTMLAIIPFISTTLASGTWDLQQGWEPIWSVTRGYPRCATFYKGRLLLGGFKSRPQTIACSVIDDIYDFDEGQAEANEGFVITIDTDQASVIYHMVPHDNLEIFTSSAEFTIGTDQIFSPENAVNIALQSRQGSKLEIRPEEIEEGGTLYVQKGGRSLQEFVLTDANLAYTNNRISITSSHLVNNPIESTLRKNTQDDESDLYLYVNEDGVLVVVTIFKGQDIVAFTRNTTDGNFKSVVAVDEDMFVVVERTIDGTALKYFEQLDFTRFTDSNIYLEASSTQIDGKELSSGSITPSDPQSNGGTVGNLIDGDPTVYYTNTVAIGTTDDYVSWQLDLGSSMAIDYVYIENLSISVGSTDEFQIETSNDNFVTDITVSSTVMELGAAETFSANVGATKRYIRLIRNGTTDLGAGVLATGEVSVYLIKDVTVSGLEYLEGKSVWTIIDGSVYGPEVVSAGSITLDKEVNTGVEIGLDFDVQIITNAFEDMQNLGPMIGNKKSFSEVIVNVNETQHILIEGYSPFRQTLSALGSSTIDNGPPTFTGRFRMLGLRGWNELGELTITQDYPMSMTLLNMGVYFNFGK